MFFGILQCRVPNPFHRALLLVVLATVVLGWSPDARSQVCTSDSIILTSQAEVDNFQTLHGPCNHVALSLWIGSSVDITNLDGLAGLVHVTLLAISGNTSLTDISGLSTITSASGILIQNNPLSHLTGLSGLTSLGALNLQDNPLLTNLGALAGLASVGNLIIAGNDLLANLHSLSGLTTVSGFINIINNPALTDISGLGNASGFESLDIRQNPLLASLDGLQGATSLTGLVLADNDSLVNVEPLTGLSSIGNSNPDVEIIDNDNLGNLNGLSSLVSVNANFTVRNNPQLDTCWALALLLDGVDDDANGPGPGAAGIPDINGAVNISFNQAGCNSIAEILDGPAITQLETIPGGAVVQGTIIDIEGEASDVGRGDSNVINVGFIINGGPLTPFTPADGNFDSPTEAFQTPLDTSALSIGMHQVCAVAEDAVGNLGGRCIQFEVTEGAIDEDWMVLCRHVPLWPQPGDTVQIRMLVTDRPEGDESLDSTPADRLEIWMDDNTAPVDFTEAPATSFFTYDSPVLSAGTFTYGCRARIGDESIFSGWRNVAVGAPAGNGPIPVAFTGLPSERVDIVFVADGDDYPGGSSDPDFLEDANEVIRSAYYAYGYYNRYQHLFNFWISRNTGHAERSSDEGDAEKTIEPPSDWEENYSFAETGAIIHTRNFREFARNGFFTIEPGERANTSSHELGHRAFGLSDEYCCDTSYYEKSIFPNVYETLESCEDDAPNLGRIPADCRSWDRMKDGEVESTWYSSEPTPNDLMNSDQSPPQAADKRRIDWIFDKCGSGEC